jgi:hypothetical protein
MRRLEIRLNDDDSRRLERLQREFGFKRKSDLFRFLINSNDVLDLIRCMKDIDLKLNTQEDLLLKSMNFLHGDQTELKKMLFLNYKSLTLLLSYFLKDEPDTPLKASRLGVENANRFLKDKEREFMEALKP